jgi:predicted ATPase
VSEAEALEELLRRHRCVTITGIGGVGKTRLAFHVARRAAKSFADGVAFVELGAISEGTLVAAKAASALGSCASHCTISTCS